MSSEKVIEVRDLTKIYEKHTVLGAGLLRSVLRRGSAGHGRRPAIASINLDVYRGDIIGILGVNGAGKTTLLSVVSGVMKPTSGTVNRWGSLVPLLGVGTNFMPELTGRENAEFNLLLMGVSRHETRRRIAAVEAFADIGHHFDAPLWTYSSGMLARVAFATALQVDAETLVIDETLSVGDVAFREKASTAIKDMQRSGRTFLLVTHNPPLITKMCTRGVVLKEGKKVFDGAPQGAVEVYADILADIVKRKTGARSLVASSGPEGVTITNVDFKIVTEGNRTRVGRISMRLRANVPVKCPALGLSIRAATGVVLARMPVATFPGWERLPSGAQSTVEVSFSQRLLAGSYVCELSIVDLSKAQECDQPPIIGSHSFRMDIHNVERSRQAGYIDLGMRIEPATVKLHTAGAQ